MMCGGFKNAKKNMTHILHAAQSFLQGIFCKFCVESKLEAGNFQGRFVEVRKIVNDERS